MTISLKPGDRVVWVGKHHNLVYLLHRRYLKTGMVSGIKPGALGGDIIVVAFDDEHGTVTCQPDNLQKLREDEDAQVFGG